MESVTHSDLAPYVSLLLLRAPATRKQRQSVAALLGDIERLIIAIHDDVTRKPVTIGTPRTGGGATIGFVHYSECRRPTWLAKSAAIKLADLVHHLIVVTQVKDLIAIYASDSGCQRAIAELVGSGDGTYVDLEHLTYIKADLLNAAFIDGQARTLWLSGLHRSTAIKADAKILSGPDLVSALNPIGDQSYTFSAVRCSVSTVNHIRSTIGVTPRKSRIWSGVSASYDDFRAQVLGILTHLHKADIAGKLRSDPIPYLAVATTDVTEIEQAYDLAIIAPELLSDVQVSNEDERALAEKYAFRARFDVTGTKGPIFQVAAHIDDALIGTFDVTPNFASNGKVTHTVAPVGVIATDLSPLAQEASRVLARRDWVSVYYETGHTISRGTCFRQQFRDQQFEAWDWCSFVDYEVHQEKPMNGKTVAFDDIGRRKSLFCFTQQRWSLADAASGESGASVWLACDDGANEIADFIRFECGGSARPRLALIHVKGSHSALKTRELSVSAYEVVVGQAVKNIRALSIPNLVTLLKKGGRNATKRYAWHDGSPQADRQGMIEALQTVDYLHEPEVVIVQPSARYSEYSRVLPESKGTKPATPPGWYYRRAQLDTLLLAAQAACFEVGARLKVVGDNS